MATNFSPCKGSYVLNQFRSNVMFGMNGFHVSASGAIQGHHGPLVIISMWTSTRIRGFVDLYQFYSYDSFGVKTDPTPGVRSWNIGTKKTNLKNSSSLKLERIEHLLVDLCQFYSHDSPWNQNSPPQESQVGNQRNKDVEFIVGKTTQVSDPGPSWPSCFTMFSDI